MEESCANRQYRAWVLISIVVLFLLFYHPGSPMVFCLFFWYLRSILVCEKGLFLIKVEYSFFLNLTYDEYC